MAHVKIVKAFLRVATEKGGRDEVDNNFPGLCFLWENYNHECLWYKVYKDKNLWGERSEKKKLFFMELFFSRITYKKMYFHLLHAQKLHISKCSKPSDQSCSQKSRQNYELITL